MSGFQLIIFDYDGTLFDTRRAIAHCLQRTFEASAKPPPSDARVSAAVNRGLVLQDTLVLLDGNLAQQPTALDDMVKTYRYMYLQQASSMLEPFPEVVATLRQLQAAGHKCVIVSNKGAVAIRQSLERCGLDSIIDSVFGQAAGLPKKPDPAVWTEYVLPHYDNVPMDQILNVGDTEVDILFAKCTGMRSCWASYGYGDAERCQNLKPDHEIARFGALLGIVAP